uniref:Mitochondrial import receptor subunit TOM22 homolog n=1 Tax=Strigamia maritima TaxID=126957 RepID=T1IKJ0_STRMM
MPSFDDVDSGLESLTTMDSKDNSPKKAELNDDDELDMDADEDLEESVAERIWGLTEMFPQVIRNSIWLMTTGSLSGIKNLYGFSRNAMWVFSRLQQF